MGRPVATALPAPSRAAGVSIVVALVAALAALGAVLALRAIERGDPRPGSKPYPTTRPVPLPFGSMAVERVDKLQEAAALGTPGRWKPGSAAALARVQVSVGVAFSNASGRPVRLDASRFSLRLGDGPGARRLGPAAGSTGVVPPGSILPGSVRFDVPRTRARLFLELRAPGASRRALVDLGTATTRTRLGAGVQVLARGHIH